MIFPVSAPSIVSTMVGFALEAFSAFLLSLAVVASPVQVERRAEAVPSFVLQNAPLAHLYSEEQWWPSDISVHVQHVVPEVNFTSVAPSVTLQNISSLGSNVFLTSKDDVTDQPDWLTSVVGKPDANGLSSAPVTIVLVNKPNGILDAFFFYFYSYDHGGKVNTSLSHTVISALTAFTLLCRSWASSSAITSAIGSTPWSALRTAPPPLSTSQLTPADPPTHSMLPRRRTAVPHHTLALARTPTTPRLDSTAMIFPAISSATRQTQVRFGTPS